MSIFAFSRKVPMYPPLSISAAIHSSGGTDGVGGVYLG